MIVEILPSKHEALARKHDFRPWQAGLLDKMFSLQGSDSLLLDMGAKAGHTYFSRVAALIEFPCRTKVYVPRQENLSEFASLLFDDSKVHEPIECLNDKGYYGAPVDFIIVDMSGEHPKRFRNELRLLRHTAAVGVVLLQPNFSVF